MCRPWSNGGCCTKNVCPLGLGRFVQGVSKMPGRTSGLSAPHQNKNRVHINICPQTSSFWVAAPTFVRPHLRGFLSVGTFENSLVQSVPNENKDKLHQRNFMPVKPFTTVPGLIQGWESPWSDVSVNALILQEDVLSICHELWLDKQYEIDGY